MKKLSGVFALAFTLLMSANAVALPPHMEADRQMIAAESAAKEQRWDDAVLAFEAVLAAKLNKRPANFDFLYGNALVQAGQYDKGKELLEAYLTTEGERAKYYREALKALNDIEQGRKRLAEDQAAHSAKQAQMAKLEAAWKDLRTTMLQMPPSGEDNCAGLTLRIKKFSKSARKIDCQCEVESSSHPAFQGKRQERCKVTWQANVILDGDIRYSDLQLDEQNPNEAQAFIISTRTP